MRWHTSSTPCKRACAAIRAEAAAFNYSWPEPEAPLQPGQSKAAATAYKIASSPAVAAGPTAATAAGGSDGADALVEEVDTDASGAVNTLASDGNGAGANYLLPCRRALRHLLLQSPLCLMS